MKTDIAMIFGLGLLGYGLYALTKNKTPAGTLPGVRQGRQTIPPPRGQYGYPGTPPITAPVGAPGLGGGSTAALISSAVGAIRSLSGIFDGRRETAPETAAYAIGPGDQVYENTGASFQPIGGILGPNESNPIGVPDVDLPDDFGIDIGAPDFGSGTALV